VGSLTSENVIGSYHCFFVMVTDFQNSVIKGTLGSLLGDLHIQKNLSSTKFLFDVGYVFVIVLNKKDM